MDFPLAGALSGAIARFVIGPLDVLKIRFQVQVEPIQRLSKSKYTSIPQAFRLILKEEGIQVLFWYGVLSTRYKASMSLRGQVEGVSD